MNPVGLMSSSLTVMLMLSQPVYNASEPNGGNPLKLNVNAQYAVGLSY